MVEVGEIVARLLMGLVTVIGALAVVWRMLPPRRSEERL